MNIVILSSTKKHTGGVERFSFYLEDCMEKSGHTVTILSREDLNSLKTLILKIKKLVGMEQPALGYFLGRLAMRRGFDICVTNGMLGWNIRHRKTVNIEHGTFARAAVRIDKGRNVFKFLIKRYVWGYFEGLSARRATVCVAVSEETKESVEKYYHAKKVVVIPNGVDTNFFKPGDKILARKSLGLPLDKKIFAFVGRLEYAKGQTILEGIREKVDAMNAVLVVAENYSQKQLAELYTAADIFLLPSLHEGCSYALLDAMSVGLPFAASPVGMVPELIAQHLFPECVVIDQTVGEYVEKIRALLALSIGQKNLLSDNIRRYILSMHSIEVFGRRYGELFQKIL